MSRKELYENKLQMDYFSDDYIRFEEDFQKYSAMDVPLTFLIDDVLRTMAIEYNDKLNGFLCQGIEEKAQFEDVQKRLISMFK